MVLDLIAASYIGWPTSRIAIRSFDNAKVQYFSLLSKFCPSIWGDFQHKFAQILRTVISKALIRNFVAFKITFRRQRARWADICELKMTDDK